MTGWSERSARLALSLAVEGGDPAVSEVAAAEGGRAAWDRVLAGEFGKAVLARAAEVDLPPVLSLAQDCSARFVIPGDDEWPEPVEALRFCDSVQRRGGVPFGLWLRGPEHLARLLPRSVSIVGSRACSAYGSTIATDLAADLADAEVAVVSGGAYGIDVAAHRGALAGQGSTVCVLANGVDIGYPRGNAAIFDRLAGSGLLISELPPGTNPSRMRFLSRNRLIAALSLGTVVVEAALRSGARNTASWAVGCHRPVMAVPGPVDSRLSEAPHLLIRNGQAMLVTGADDVLEMISPAGQHTQPTPSGTARLTDTLDPTRLAVYEAVPARRRCSVGEIALVAGVSMPTCLAQLAELERADLVEGGDDGWRARPLPAVMPIGPGQPATGDI
jgi:DNA processing protein